MRGTFFIDPACLLFCLLIKFFSNHKKINTADELILTELVLENFLADYDSAEIVALLSVFVFQEKSQSTPRLTQRLEAVEYIILIFVKFLY